MPLWRWWIFLRRCARASSSGHNDKNRLGFYEQQNPDVMDLFIEKINPDNPKQYEADGKWVDFLTHTETINVVGDKRLPLQCARRHEAGHLGYLWAAKRYKF